MSEQRILVVDDHEPLLTAIQGILEAEGYVVSTATDGQQALNVMEEVTPNLVIADIMMPRMDGYALYRAIRARPEWISIPFIFLTAKAEKEDKLKGKSLGAEDYLTKPFDTQELLVAVRSRLERAKAIQDVTEAQFNQLKQQIASILGHELRTPLTYVRGYTELALEEVSDTEGLQAFLTGIKRGADRLNRLVEDLMLLVQIDTGRAIEEYNLLVRPHHDLGSILKSTVQHYEKQAIAQGVMLRTEIEPNLPELQLCEPLFADALGRLIDNAIKFSRRKEKLVTITTQAEDEWVDIAIADKGVGIAPENMPHLFERFRQFDRETMEQQGIGLGLALAKELVNLHKGEIIAESTLGEGSTFTIRLPTIQD